MKLTMKLTMDGLMRSLTYIARSMAEDTEWRYAGLGQSNRDARTLEIDPMSRTERHDLRGD